MNEDNPNHDTGESDTPTTGVADDRKALTTHSGAPAPDDEISEGVR